MMNWTAFNLEQSEKSVYLFCCVLIYVGAKFLRIKINATHIFRKGTSMVEGIVFAKFVKVKLILYRPTYASRAPGVCGSRFQTTGT